MTLARHTTLSGALLALTLAPALAVAQAPGQAAQPAEVTTPTLPQNPTSPGDFQGPARPGVGPAPSAAAPADVGGAPDGYSGGDLIITDTNPALYGGKGKQRMVPKEHTVTKGQTMWNLCDHYYGDPWAWPQLWAYNKSITNPHWIYPGDLIKMLAPTATRQRKRHKPEPVTVRTVDRDKIRKYVRLRQRAFVEKKELKKAAQIIGSPEEKWMITRFDHMYIVGKHGYKLRLGRIYSIYRIEKKLVNAKGRQLGFLVKILGTARIKRMQKGRAATALVLAAYHPIERGDKVGPLRKLYQTTRVRPAERNVEARVIANLNDTRTVGTDTVVFLDAGKSQGVRPGNRFLVVRRGDGFTTILGDAADQTDVDKRFPDETVAEISVLDVHEDASVGLVTRAKKEVRDGDYARLRRGY